MPIDVMLTSDMIEPWTNDALLGTRERMRTLCFDDSANWSHTLIYFLLDREVFPSLETLNITHGRTTLKSFHLPNLRVLQLDFRFQHGWNEFNWRSLGTSTRLMEIKLVMTEPTNSGFLGDLLWSLQHVPSLNSLIFEMSISPQTILSPCACEVHKVHLPQLTHITLHAAATMVVHLLSHLIFPDNTKINLDLRGSVPHDAAFSASLLSSVATWSEPLPLKALHFRGDVVAFGVESDSESMLSIASLQPNRLYSATTPIPALEYEQD